MRIALTSPRIKQATCSPDKGSVDLWDSTQPGLLVRVYRTGRKVFMVFYRVGTGRKALQRWDQLGDAGKISLQDARDAARIRLGAVAKGRDPAGERRAQAKRDRARLGPALDAYEADLIRRKVVKTKDRLSLLRRELLGALGNVELGAITRNDVVLLLNAIEQDGRPGAAQDLRKNAAVFLNWAVDNGLITASPLAGWRRPRRTRAQLVARPGRALEDWELPILWRVAAETGWPFGPYLQMLLLLGQRRLETSLMSWADVDLGAGVWTLPAEITKSGRQHKVPLPPAAVAILAGLPRTTGVYVFPGRHGGPMSGWSKRLPVIVAQTSAAGMAPWTPHDLRRTMRTGFGQLGVDRVVAELLLNHDQSEELAKIYDRGDYWPARVGAAGRWADHVAGSVDGAGTKVVRIPSSR